MKEKRYLTKDELKEISLEQDMLTGNINRMCVTDSLKELFKMYDVALHRISRIYNTNLDRLIEDIEEGDSNE